MRLRNNPHARDMLAAAEHYLADPRVYRGRWSEYFGNDGEIRIEVGSGKGQFIIAMAQANPNINFIAVERCATIALKLIKSIPADLANLVVVGLDADLLCEYLDDGEISRLYLNFSDPWPKKRHAKRRLTSPHFLEIYRRILKDGSLLEFKTDNRPFFDYTIEQLKDSAFELRAITYDLYSSDLLKGNVPTEYELRFHNLGTPINKLIAQLDKSKIKKSAAGDE